MTDPTIAGVGAYTPAARLSADELAEAWDGSRPGAIERVAVPDGDEDAITMAWEAGRRALSAANADAADVAWLTLATTTPPLEEGDVAARLAHVLRVPATVETQLLSGSTRAGTRALALGNDVGPWAEGVGLVIAADAPAAHPAAERGHAAGAGAAAVVLDEAGPGRIVDASAHTPVAPGVRYRRPGSTDVEGLGITSYDRADYERAVVGAVDALDEPIDTVDGAALATADATEPYRVADALGLDQAVIGRATAAHDVGDAGVAAALLGLATAMADGADRVLVVGHGGGAGADALVLDVADVPIDAALEGSREVSYAAALRHRGTIATPTPPEGGGAYVSLPTWRESLPARHHLEAGRCGACGGLTYPPRGACQVCDATADVEPVTLPGTGTVEAVTTVASGGAPPEFVVQQSRSGAFDVAIVALDGPDGGSVSAPMQAVVPADRLAVGDRVRTVIRRLYVQEGLPRYGRKVIPLPE